MWKKEIEGLQLREFYMTATSSKNLAMKTVETIEHPINTCIFSGLNAEEVCEIAFKMIQFAMRYSEAPYYLHQSLSKQLVDLDPSLTL